MLALVLATVLTVQLVGVGQSTALADHLMSVAKEVCYAHGDSPEALRISAVTFRWTAISEHQTRQFGLVRGELLGAWAHTHALGRYIVLQTRGTPAGAFACNITAKVAPEDYFGVRAAFRKNFNYQSYEHQKVSTDWVDYYGLIRPPKTRVIGSIAYNVATGWLTVGMTVLPNNN